MKAGFSFFNGWRAEPNAMAEGSRELEVWFQTVVFGLPVKTFVIGLKGGLWAKIMAKICKTWPKGGLD